MKKKPNKNWSDEMIGIIHVEVFRSFSFQKPLFLFCEIFGSAVRRCYGNWN